MLAVTLVRELCHQMKSTLHVSPQFFPRKIEILANFEGLNQKFSLYILYQLSSSQVFHKSPISAVNIQRFLARRKVCINYENTCDCQVASRP